MRILNRGFKADPSQSVDVVPVYGPRRRLRTIKAKLGLPRVIISLTTYPGRIEAVRKVLINLHWQTVLPDEIAVWLDADEFEQAGVPQKDVEAQLKVSRRVRVYWITGGLKSFNKYYWILQRKPKSIVITVDDDLLYRWEMVEDLLATHRTYPHAFISQRSHFPRLDESGEFLPYKQWEFCQQRIIEKPTLAVFTNDGAGALYPPRAFDKDFFDRDAFMKLCPRNDDIWLNVYLLRKRIEKVVLPFPKLDYIPGTQETGLWKQNQGGTNDEYLANLFEAYPDAKQTLLDAVNSVNS